MSVGFFLTAHSVASVWPTLPECALPPVEPREFMNRANLCVKTTRGPFAGHFTGIFK